MRSLETKLVAKHEEELKAAREEARKEALQSAGGSKDDEGGVSAEEHDQALKAAVERGRREISVKLKLKEQMLIKAQSNVKHLEAQIKAWRDEGIVPPDAPTLPPPPASTPAKLQSENASLPASTSAKPVVTPTATKPIAARAPVVPPPINKPSPAAPNSAAAAPAGSPTVTTPANGVPTATPATLPKKPVVNVAANAAEASVRGGVRGVQRGVRGVRGVTRGGAPRGGAPAALAQAAASTADTGMSIMGAAAKRGREEPEAAESLAKRIKPADSNQAKPVALRRDRISTTTAPNQPS